MLLFIGRTSSLGTPQVLGIEIRRKDLLLLQEISSKFENMFGLSAFDYRTKWENVIWFPKSLGRLQLDLDDSIQNSNDRFVSLSLENAFW